MRCLIPPVRCQSGSSAKLKCRWHLFDPIVDERGYGSVLALMLLFGGVLLIGVAVDVTRLIATWRETAHLAATAAETGAGWVRSEDLYLGQLVLDPDAAKFA